MATFDLTFQARSTSASPEAIRTRAEELDTLQARLLGRADDLNGDFNSSATQFTDLIGWNIKGRADEDYQHWKDAGVAIVYAASKLEEWAQYVEDFKEERSAQNTEWFDFRTAKEGEIPAEYQGQTITATYPERGGFLGISDESKCRDIYDEVAAKLEDLNERERTNYQAFEEHADEVAADIREGPTKANVQALIDAGINSWAFYNLDPNHYTMLVDGRELTEENAQEWADELSDYWSGDKPLDERYHELMLMMSMIGSNAMQAQQGGTGYREEEMDFLREFYDTLEEENPNDMGVLGIPSQMEGDHLTNEERTHALGMLGDGLLALSDHRLGGGYYDLPESVRRASEGLTLIDTENTGVYSPEMWAGEISSLASLLGNASPDMEPGYGLGATLTLSLGHHAAEQPEEIGIRSIFSEEEMQNLVDVATRNRDANHDILTGEYVHPNSVGEDGNFIWTELDSDEVEELGEEEAQELANRRAQEGIITNALEGLFTYDWPDDGESAGGLIDWIHEDRLNGSIEEQERAGNAAAGMIDTVTGTKLFETLTTVYDADEGAAIPMGEINPQISQDMLGVFDAYLHDFGMGERDKNEFLTDANVSRSPHADNGHSLSLNEMSRVRFMELIAGDEDSSAGMFASIEDKRINSEDEWWSTGEANEEESRNNGRLSALFDSAMSNYGMSRYDSDQDAYEHEVQARKQGWDIVVGALSGPIPYAGGLVGDGGKALIAPITEGSVPLYPEYEDQRSIKPNSLNSYRFDLQLQIIHSQLGQGEVTLDDIPSNILIDGQVPISSQSLYPHGDPDGLTETLSDDFFSTSENDAIEERAEDFNEGYGAFDPEIRASDKHEYETHVNPGRRN